MKVLWTNTRTPVVTIIEVDDPYGFFMFEHSGNLIVASRMTETIDKQTCYAYADEFTIPDGCGFSADELYLMWIYYYFFEGGWDYKPPVRGEWYYDYTY